MKTLKKFSNIIIPASIVLGNFAVGIVVAEVIIAVLA
jgi:hypothetical protein